MGYTWTTYHEDGAETWQDTWEANLDSAAIVLVFDTMLYRTRFTEALQFEARAILKVRRARHGWSMEARVCESIPFPPCRRWLNLPLTSPYLTNPPTYAPTHATPRRTPTQNQRFGCDRYGKRIEGAVPTISVYIVNDGDPNTINDAFKGEFIADLLHEQVPKKFK